MQMSPTMLQQLLSRPADAYAVIQGSEQYPALSGEVWFFPLWGGTLVAAEVRGLPSAGMRSCAPGIHDFHIHEGGSCSPSPFRTHWRTIIPDNVRIRVMQATCRPCSEMTAMHSRSFIRISLFRKKSLAGQS